MLESPEKEYSSTVDGMLADHASLISIESLAIPVAILSIEDGVVVNTNAKFKKLIQNCSIGQPLSGLLHTQSARQTANEKIGESGQHVFVKKNRQIHLRFSVTKESYAGVLHFIVCIENLKAKSGASESATNSDESGMLDRSEFIHRLGKLFKDHDDPSDQCVCYIDIDRFRIVNEKYGFEAGNYVLDEVHKVIKSQIDPADVTGRIGDNEFGLLLNNRQINKGLQVCEQICQAIRSHQFVWGDEKISLTVSIGVIPVRKELDDVNFILGAADLALRAAQENGRDCVRSSATQDTMMAYHSDNMRYALVIEDALQHDKFQLYGQPIVSLADPTKHAHYEILLRSFDPKIGEFISSQELISAAESLEVTTKIDQWVCENIFRELSQIAQSNKDMPYISINLSGHSIVNSTFETYIKDLVSKYQVPANHICFEITESVAVKSISRAQKFIGNLRDVGFQFSLDDFGVGYCSFNYLQQLEVDNVKIDGAFVSAMLDSAPQFAMVKAITDVARAMNIKTIAEFVEKPEIIKALTVIGVDYGQGYIFGKPTPVKDLF